MINPELQLNKAPFQFDIHLILFHQKFTISLTTLSGAITFALILQKFRLRLSYTSAHKSGAFALSFGVTLAPIYSQLFLGQLLVFEPRCKKIGLRGSVFESLSFLNLKPSCIKIKR